jgi:hypothetical protein
VEEEEEVPGNEENDGAAEEDETNDFELVDINEAKRLMGLAGTMVFAIGERKESIKRIGIQQLTIKSTEILGGEHTLPLPLPPTLPLQLDDPFESHLTRQDFRAAEIQLLLQSINGVSSGLELSALKIFQYYIGSDTENCVKINLKEPPVLLGSKKKKVTKDPYSGLLRSAISIVLTFLPNDFQHVKQYFQL